MSGAEARFIVGVDEAGRGPLAGPVTAGAVLLGPAVIEGLADSKALSEARRAEMSAVVIEECMAYCVAEATVEEIEELNILEATFTAMQRAVSGLVICPDEVLVDGNRLPELPYPAQAVVGGDAKVPEIMAASILAKHARDERMAELDRLYPEYGFARHKGYPTKAHLAALEKLGPCEAHRMGFAPVRKAAEKAAAKGPREG